MEDVNQFEAKYGDKADLAANSKDTRTVKSQIEVPWMNGKHLMERWGVNLDELYQAIFFLHLPVYNSSYEELGGIDPDGTGGPSEDPLSHLNDLTIHPTWPYIWGESVDEILCNLYFKIEDVKEFEAKHGKDKKDLPDDNDKKSEFAVYDSIVNGECRPFLEIYSSKNHIEKLREKLWRVSFIKTEDGWEHASESEKLLLEITSKTGDTIKIEFDETDPKKPAKITNITDNELEELFDIDIPPPPDLKAEYFLDLIELEYEKIKLRAKKFLETSHEETQISLYANKNIQIAKRIAFEANTLSKQLKPGEKISLWDHPDSYIIDILKHFLIKSILFYQGLFQPYLKVPIQDEFQLRTFLYGERSFEAGRRDFEKRLKNIIYKNLSIETRILKPHDDTSLDHTVAALKILTSTEKWLNTVSEEAVLRGFVGISHLTFILASDQNYLKNSILELLFANFLSEFDSLGELSISDYKSRIDIWRQLTNLWATGNYPRAKQFYDTYLPLYLIDETTKEIEKIDLREKYKQLVQKRMKEGLADLPLEEQIELAQFINSAAKFIKLSELKRYFVDVIGIPLPSLLFPKGTENKDKKLRPSQKAREECKIIAKKIWEKNPQITIADMINHPNLLTNTTKKDGNLYAEKTVRNWIKDLCPDRSPGRRKRT
jgi:hypothetical protein